MNFNLTKYNIMSITSSSLNFPAGYRLCNSPLRSIFCHKYFGVLMRDNLKWDSHVKSVKHKAMKILGLLGRNFSGSSQYVKTQAYNTLVRPHVEYASAAWSPFEKQHIKALEAVQCCAIRFVCLDYSQFSSVTSMQHSLGWDTLEVRRHLNTATIMYKAVHNWTHLTFPASVTLAHRRLIEAIALTILISSDISLLAPMHISFPFSHLLSPFGMAFPILLLILNLLLTSKRMLCHP